MDASTILVVALRVLGIYCAVEAIALLQGATLALATYRTFGGANADLTRIGFAGFVPVVLQVLLALCLILFAKSITRTLISESDPDVSSRQKLDERTFQAMAFSVLGIAVCVIALPGLVSALSAVFADIRQSPDGLEHSVSRWASIIGVLLQFVVGLGLFFQSHRLSTVWNRLNEPNDKNKITI